jgi:transposase
MEVRTVSLDSTIAVDHEVRLIWEFVEHMDLSRWYAEIKAVEGQAGRTAIDPAILFGLWLYATLQGVGSARKLDRLCQEHDAYRWLCGGVTVNYHTLADFRVGHEDWVDDLLTESVAALIADGLVTMKRVSQDGKHVRASAGSGSFRRREKLEKHLQTARQQVVVLRKELESDPQVASKRELAARQRAVKEREQRLSKALDRLNEIEKPHKSSAKKSQPTQETSQKKRKREPRASMTDAEAHVMKMADGGFRPAYDVQFSTDTETLVIGGVIVSNQGNDKGMLTPMQDQYQERYGLHPDEVLVDGGFVDYKDFEQVTLQGTTVYAPPASYRSNEPDPYQPQPNDTPAIAEWRNRMGTEAAKEIYKLRAATAECVNAICTNRGMTQFVVRGLKKVRAVALWYALLHNLLRGLALRLAQAS